MPTRNRLSGCGVSRRDMIRIGAGGLGFGLLAFFGATLRPGVEIVMDAVRLRDRLARADLCITFTDALTTLRMNHGSNGRAASNPPIE